MNRKHVKKMIWQNLPFYLTALLLLFVGKYLYSRAGSDDLRWILLPTAGWVQLLSGIPFVYVPDMGYVNHELRILIAASCSGVQFMLIAAVTFIFSYVHRAPDCRWMPFGRGQMPDNSILKGKKNLRRICWVLFSILLSYLCTILVNGLRIITAIYLPAFVDRMGLWNSILTPERLHTAIGVAVYFASLLSLHQLAGRLFEGTHRTNLPPAFWYFAIVLGIPAANNALGKNREAFGEFSLLILLCCGAVLALSCLITAGRKRS